MATSAVVIDRPIGSTDFTGLREETRAWRTVVTAFTGFSVLISGVEDLVRARGFVTSAVTLISGVGTLTALDFLVSILISHCSLSLFSPLTTWSAGRFVINLIIPRNRQCVLYKFILRSVSFIDVSARTIYVEY